VPRAQGTPSLVNLDPARPIVRCDPDRIAQVCREPPQQRDQVLAREVERSRSAPPLATAMWMSAIRDHGHRGDRALIFIQRLFSRYERYEKGDQQGRRHGPRPRHHAARSSRCTAGKIWGRPASRGAGSGLPFHPAGRSLPGLITQVGADHLAELVELLERGVAPRPAAHTRCSAPPRARATRSISSALAFG